MKQINCQFTGSYFTLEQLPNDIRPQIAFAGRSNVGKSTLLNKLTGRKKLAKVSATPGKTRSINFFLVNDSFYFVDLPGYGYAKVSKAERNAWGRLIETYLTTSKGLVGLILLLDCRREPTGEDIDLIHWMAENELPGIFVITKADKLNRDKINRKVKAIETEFGMPAVPFSAVKGTGKKEILAAVEMLLERKR